MRADRSVNWRVEPERRLDRLDCVLVAQFADGDLCGEKAFLPKPPAQGAVWRTIRPGRPSRSAPGRLRQRRQRKLARPRIGHSPDRHFNSHEILLPVESMMPLGSDTPPTDAHPRQQFRALHRKTACWYPRDPAQWSSRHAIPPNPYPESVGARPGWCAGACHIPFLRWRRIGGIERRRGVGERHG